MGRVFTTMFEFDGEEHIAMVTVNEDLKGLTHYHVQLFNKELHHLIPEGKLMFTSTDNSLPPTIQGRAATELFHSIKSAMEKHMCSRSEKAEENMINKVKHDSNNKPSL